MEFDFPSLTPEVRSYMLAELDFDLNEGTLYYSPRLSPNGKHLYPDLLRTALQSGNERTLAQQLRLNHCISSYEARKYKQVRVPSTAADTLSGGEFNRFYIRGLCSYAIDNEIEYLEVCRGKHVRQSRPRSTALIGQQVYAYGLRADLRARPGLETALGIPGGPNSGITLKIPT